MISKKHIYYINQNIKTTEKFIRCPKCNNISSCCFFSDKLYCEACDLEYGLQTRFGEWNAYRRILTLIKK